MIKTKDLLGQIFGKLTVVERADDYISPKGHNSARWKCVCNCKIDNPNYVVIRASSLVSGGTRSCGCFKKGTHYTTHRINTKYNTHDLTGEYGIGYTVKGESFFFDIEDYDKIKDYYAYINALGYVNMTKSNTQIYMHRRVMDAKKNEIVDHINHNTSDNRKENLRIVTTSQNMMNKKMPSVNISGIKGVRYINRYSPWVAFIMLNGKSVQKSFHTKDEAIDYRKLLEKKYHGEYALKEDIKQIDNIIVS